MYKGNIIKNLIMDCQSYTKYRPNETTVLDQIAQDHAAPVAQVAVNWNAQKDFVSTSLCGVRNAQEAIENCRGFEWSLSQEEMERIDKAIDEYL